MPVCGIRSPESERITSLASRIPVTTYRPASALLGTLQSAFALASYGRQVVCGRKNYRLQDIQLSKSFYPPGEKSLGILSVVAGFVPRTPGSLHSRGPFAPLRFARPNFSFYPSERCSSRRASTQSDAGPSGPQPRQTPEALANFQCRAGVSGSPRGANAGGICKLNKVENTGLEPVTSWLQTRRSPS